MYYIYIIYIYIKDYPIYYGKNNPNRFPSIPSIRKPSQPKLDQDGCDPRIRALLRAKHYVRLTHLHIAIPSASDINERCAVLESEIGGYHRIP